MLRRTLLLGSCLATTLAVVGCFDQTTTPVIAPAASRMSTAELQRQSSLTGTIELSRDQALPGGAFARVADLGVSHAGERAINPKDYVCGQEVLPLIDWLNAEVDKTLAVEPQRFFAMYNRFADLIPTYEALVFQSSATPQSYGYTGEFTKAMRKVEKDVKGFWDIPSKDIQVVAMHGTMLRDVNRVAATYEAVFGLTPASAQRNAKIVSDSLARSTTMNGGNYGLWTFNSVSYPGDDELPKKIVMGDGIMEGYKAIGYEDVAPQAIFAHEFAHQIQFANGYFGDLPATVSQPEQTRYTELMADAYSAYYLTHMRGGKMKRKRAGEFLHIFFQIGDCAFTNDGHHGTPNQRLASATFGFDLADQSANNGHILSSAAFHALFVAKYPAIIAPDAI